MDLNLNNAQVHSGELGSKVSSPSIDSYPLPIHWKTFICSEENLRHAFDKIMQFPIIFEDEYRGDFRLFCSELISPSTIIFSTGDYGLCAIKNIVPFRDADVHLCFWDRRFKGRNFECSQAIKWVFDKLSLARLTIQIPETARATNAFILSLGFKREGLIRSNYMYKKKLLNTLIFGMLREEALKTKSLSQMEV